MRRRPELSYKGISSYQVSAVRRSLLVLSGEGIREWPRLTIKSLLCVGSQLLTNRILLLRREGILRNLWRIGVLVLTLVKDSDITTAPRECRILHDSHTAYAIT